MWEVFPAQVCHKALQECGFAKELGLWPEFLDCGKYVEMAENNYPIAHTHEQEQRLFTDKSNCSVCLQHSQIAVRIADFRRRAWMHPPLFSPPSSAYGP